MQLPKAKNTSRSESSVSYKDHPFPWRRYALAVVATVVTLVIRLLLASWMGERPFLILFILPIVISAYVGGVGPGLLCTVLVGLSTDYFVMPPVHSFGFAQPLDFAQWTFLLVLGTLISLLSDGAHGSTAKPLYTTGMSAQRKVQGGFGFALACLGLVGSHLTSQSSGSARILSWWRIPGR